MLVYLANLWIVVISTGSQPILIFKYHGISTSWDDKLRIYRAVTWENSIIWYALLSIVFLFSASFLYYLSISLCYLPHSMSFLLYCMIKNIPRILLEHEMISRKCLFTLWKINSLKCFMVIMDGFVWELSFIIEKWFLLCICKVHLVR